MQRHGLVQVLLGRAEKLESGNSYSYISYYDQTFSKGMIISGARSLELLYRTIPRDCDRRRSGAQLITSCPTLSEPFCRASSFSFHFSIIFTTSLEINDTRTVQCRVIRELYNHHCVKAGKGKPTARPLHPSDRKRMKPNDNVRPEHAIVASCRWFSLRRCRC